MDDQARHLHNIEVLIAMVPELADIAEEYMDDGRHFLEAIADIATAFAQAMGDAAGEWAQDGQADDGGTSGDS